MRFYKMFGISSKEIGKFRDKYIQRIEREIGSSLEYRSVNIPTVTDSEKRQGFPKILGATQPERVKKRFFLFSADVVGQSFKHLVGYLAPIPKQGRGFTQEYTYTTVLPYPIDSGICFLEKWRLVYRKSPRKGYNFVPPRKSVSHKHAVHVLVEVGFYPLLFRFEEIPEETLFQGEDTRAFNVTLELSQTRIAFLRRFTPYPISVGKEGYYCASLNEQEGLSKQMQELRALSHEDPQHIQIWITALLVPLAGKTLIQIADYKLKPRLAVDTLETISVALEAANACFRT